MLDLEQRFPYREGNFQLFSHPDCLLHEVGEWHPESPARLRSIVKGCATLLHLPVSFRIPPPATVEQLELVHDKEYLLQLEESCASLAPCFMSPDNHIGRGTFRAVLAAGGCALALAETLLKREAGFALIRPPGHHAGRKIAEGFCFINHIALAIESIRQREPEATFLVVDFDVHHGNGIDYLYSYDPKVYYYSLHGAPDHIFPHSGYRHDSGEGEGTGFTRNVTLPLESTGQEWLRQFQSNLYQVELQIKPDYLLVGAGFDAHREDPFGVMHLEDRHFLQAVRQLKHFAEDHCGGRIGFFLEGGYAPAVLQRLVPETIALLAAPPSLW